MKKTDPVPGGAAEKSQAELEKKIETAFDEEIIKERIIKVFPNGGKSGKEKRETAWSCIAEIKADLFKAVKGEDKKNWTEAIKKKLNNIADEIFRAQKGIDPQQAVELVRIMGNSLRLSEESPDDKEGTIITPVVDDVESEEKINVNPVGVPIEKLTKPEAEENIPYEFADGVREKYLEGKSGKKKAEAEERLARCAKEIGIKIAEMKKAGKDTDENKIVLSVIRKVKSLRAIFEEALTKGEGSKKEDKKENMKESGGPLPEDEKKSQKLTDFLVELERLRKNREERKEKGGIVRPIILSPKKFGIADNKEIKLAHGARDRVNREMARRKPKPENSGDQMTLDEFQAKVGEFKKNYYNDEDVRLNIQKYNTRSGLATIFIGDGDEGKEEVSVEKLLELRAIYKNTEKKRKPEGNGEKMTRAEFQLEFGDKLRKNFFNDSGVRMNIADDYNELTGNVTVHIGKEKDGSVEKATSKRLRELLSIYNKPETKKKPEAKKKSFKEIMAKADALEENASVAIKAALENGKLAETDLSDLYIDSSKLDPNGLNEDDMAKVKGLVKIKNEKIFEYFKKAEITEKNREYWERFTVSKKKFIDKIKSKNISEIEGIDFAKILVEKGKIEITKNYAIKLNGVLDENKKWPDKIRKDVADYVQGANNEISKKLEAKRVEMKNFLADNHDAINGRKMDEMDRVLWEQGKKTFEEAALKVSIELDAELKKIGYWKGFSEEGRVAVLREKISNFLLGKLVEKYSLEAGEAKKRADEIMTVVGEPLSLTATKSEKNADARMEEVGQSVVGRVLDKFGREIDLKIVTIEKGSVNHIKANAVVGRDLSVEDSSPPNNEDEKAGTLEDDEVISKEVIEVSATENPATVEEIAPKEKHKFQLEIDVLVKLAKKYRVEYEKIEGPVSDDDFKIELVDFAKETQEQCGKHNQPEDVEEIVKKVVELFFNKSN